MSRVPRMAWFGGALWLALALPWVRHALEASMTLQMLVQLPLLVVVGCWVAALAPRRLRGALAAWNCKGISGLLLASLAALVWMLPRALDAALNLGWVEAAKFASVPLLVGVPLALSWPRAGFVVRGMLLAEAIAMTFRLGWLYLESPVRLCSNYLLDDQQTLGMLLLLVGGGAVVLLAAQLLWGHIELGGQPRRRVPPA